MILTAEGKPAKDYWITVVKGNHTCGTFEISIVKWSNTHGQESYGWPGEDKIIISSNGGFNMQIPKELFEELVKLARSYAQFLNKRI